MRFILFCMLSFSVLISAEEPDTAWTRMYGGNGDDDCFYSVEQTADGGYIVSGKTGVGSGASWLVKTDAAGDTLWTSAIGSSTEDKFYQVRQTASGGRYICVGGKYHGGGEAAYFTRTDTAGAQSWYRVVDRMYLTDVRQTADYGFAATGRKSSNDGGIWLIKTDSAGVVVLDTSYDGQFSSKLQVLADGGYLLAAGDYDEDGDTAVYLLCTDAAGAVQWARASDNTTEWIQAYDVILTSDNGIVVVGVRKLLAEDDEDVILRKLDQNGTVLWTKIFDRAEYDCGYSVAETYEGGFIITGSSAASRFGDENALWVLRTNSVGDTIWTKTFNYLVSSYLDDYSQVIVGSDSSYVIATTNSTGSYYCGWLIKINKETDLSVMPSVRGVQQNNMDLQVAPGRGSAIINYILPVAGSVDLSVCDLMGRKVYQAASGHHQSGSHQINWRYNSKLGSGVYWVRLKNGNSFVTRRFLVLK